MIEDGFSEFEKYYIGSWEFIGSRIGLRVNLE